MEMANIQLDRRLDGIAQLLIHENLLGKEEALHYQQLSFEAKQRFPSFLVKNQFISAFSLAQIISKHFGLPFLNLDLIEINPNPFALLSKTLIHRHHVIPLAIDEQWLTLATDDPGNQNGFKEIQFHTGLGLQLKVVETDKLNLYLDNLFNKSENENLAARNEDPSVVELVNQILDAAVQKKASDIHFEPYEQEYRIRYRLDGLLSEVAKPSLHLANRISSRIKVMANLDIAERRKPQDGGFRLGSHEKNVDFRVSTCPTLYGEKIAIRILDTHYTQLNMDTLGLSSGQKIVFLESLSKPQGLILVTGPTGSGKTLTLYTALNHLNSKERNISTAEDPVEIKIPGINQVNMFPKIGVNFQNILRALLRQDPDIIMVGEIRDEETAELAIKAAQTGHLVLSTVHTNSAAETLIRLQNLGIKAFNIANSLTLLISQRLVRTLCEHCKVPHDKESLRQLAKHDLAENELQTLTIYKAIGCSQCTKGYSGRIGLFELIPISKKLQENIRSTEDSFKTLLNLAKAEGMISIYQSGLEKVKQGLTTFEELNRVIND